MTEPPKVSADERDAVRQSARTHALDWYLSALLAPPAARDDLVALAAYTGETGRVALTAHEAALGAIRLQWWRDAIENVAEGLRTGSPVADAVVAAARRHAIPAELVALPLAGREREIDADGIHDERAFEAYLAETWGGAFRLATEVLGVPASDAMRALCDFAGGAYGRARIALDLPHFLAQGRLPLPASRLSEGDPRMLPGLEARTATEALVRVLGKEARAALAEARNALRTAPRAARPAFLPLALVEPYFRALEARSHDPMRDIADISPLARVARLWLANVRGRV